MFSRSKVVAAVIAAGAALSTAPAQAYDAPGTSPFIDIRPDESAIGACNFLFSGPSLDPSSTPFRIEGSATVTSSRKVVVSTSIRCRLKLASSGAQVGGVLQRALPGNTTAVAGDIHVSSFGPFLICTFIDAVFDDTSHFNNTNDERCQPLQRI